MEMEKLSQLLIYAVHLELITEAVTRGAQSKKVFSEISQDSQENTGLRPATLFKNRLWHRCFPVNFPKFLRTFFLQNTSGQLLL